MNLEASSWHGSVVVFVVVALVCCLFSMVLHVWSCTCKANNLSDDNKQMIMDGLDSLEWEIPGLSNVFSLENGSCGQADGCGKGAGKGGAGPDGFGKSAMGPDGYGKGGAAIGFDGSGKGGAGPMALWGVARDPLGLAKVALALVMLRLMDLGRATLHMITKRVAHVVVGLARVAVALRHHLGLGMHHLLVGTAVRAGVQVVGVVAAMLAMAARAIMPTVAAILAMAARAVMSIVAVILALVERAVVVVLASTREALAALEASALGWNLVEREGVD